MKAWATYWSVQGEQCRVVVVTSSRHRAVRLLRHMSIDASQEDLFQVQVPDGARQEGVWAAPEGVLFTDESLPTVYFTVAEVAHVRFVDSSSQKYHRIF